MLLPQHIQCPGCAQAYAITAADAGRYANQPVRCTACGRAFTVPDLAARLAARPASALFDETTAAPPESPPIEFPPPEIPVPLSPVGRWEQPPPPPPSGSAVAAMVAAFLGMFIPTLPSLVAICLAGGVLIDGKPGRKLALASLVVAVLGIIITSGALYFVVAPAMSDGADRAGDTYGADAERARCAERMRAVGHALMQYAADHGGAFPDTLDRLHAAAPAAPPAAPTASPAASFAAPAGPAAGPGRAGAGEREGVGVGVGVGAAPLRPEDLRCPALPAGDAPYAYAGGGLTRAAAPPDAILLYEPLHHHAPGGINVLFADGRTSALGPAASAQAIKRLNAGHNPPWEK